MNWDYIAGLFDGEGSTTLTLVGKYIMLTNNIAVSDKFAQAIRDFLKEYGINATYFKFKNPKGQSCNLQISSFESNSRFTNLLLDRVLLKRRQLELSRAILSTYFREGARLTKGNFEKYDSFRQQLHEIAQKGPKNLKPWVLNT